jgi:predicted hydrocarbon binding protein
VSDLDPEVQAAWKLLFENVQEQEEAKIQAAGEREIVDCPFCEGAEFGCCWCDHTGHVYEDTETPKPSPDSCRRHGGEPR